MSEENIVRLEYIAAKAKQMAMDLRAGKLWPGQLSEAISEIKGQLDQVKERGSRT